MAQLNKGTTYSVSNPTVTIDNLNALVDNASLLPGAISDQTALAGNADPATAQAIILTGGSLRKATIQQVLGGILPSSAAQKSANLSDLSSIATAKVNLVLNNVENKSSATIRGEITSGNVTTALGFTPLSASSLNPYATTLQLQGYATTAAVAALTTANLNSFVTTNQISAFATTEQVQAINQQIPGFATTAQVQGFATTAQIPSISGVVSTAQLGAINGVATLGPDQKLTASQLGALTSPTQLQVIGTQALAAIGAQPILSLPLALNQGGTGTTVGTGSGSVVLQNSPTLISPTLGTPVSGNLSNCTNIPLGNATGVLAVTNGGSGHSAYSAGQLLIGNSAGGLTKATLTAGANVSITNGNGAITVASSVPAATNSTLGGVIPGSGLSVTSGVLNGIFPKAIASFSGQFTDSTQVSGIVWVRSAGSNQVLVSKTGIVNDEKIKVGHRIYFSFVANVGSTAPSAQYVQVVSINGDNLTCSLTVPGTPPASGNWNGSCTFRKCLVHYIEGIDSIIVGATATATGHYYMVNLSSTYANANFIPLALNCGFTTAAGIIASSAFTPEYDVNGATVIQRTTNSFALTGVNNADGGVQFGYRSGLLVFGNYS